MCILFIYNFQDVYHYLLLLLQYLSTTFIDFIPSYKKSNNKKANNKKENTKAISNNNKVVDSVNKLNNEANIKKEISNNSISNKYIDELRKQLDDEKNKNKILEDENNAFKNIINKLNQDYKSSIRKYENDNKNYISKIKTLENNIQKLSLENDILKEKINSLTNNNINEGMLNLYKRIDDLTEKLNRFPFYLEKDEKMLSIIFMSIDQNINYPIICKNTDTINILETELYKKYPEFSETDNYFLCKGTVMNRFKKFEDLNIKNGDIIVLNKREE